MSLGAWLDAELARAPENLAAIIRRETGVGGREPLRVADLERIAERLLEQAKRTANTRAGALTLLAADGLTTLIHLYPHRSPVSRLPSAE